MTARGDLAQDEKSTIALFKSVSPSVVYITTMAVRRELFSSRALDVPQGADIQAYASVMDNHTGDPVLIPAEPPPDSPVYLPAVAHLNGEAGTVWRTDLALANPDPNSAHTWELRFLPKGGTLPIVARSVTLAPLVRGRLAR